MQTLNPRPVITEDLFGRIVESIESLCRDVSVPQMEEIILTEADLQSWIFYRLISGLEELGRGQVGAGEAGLHCNIAFLDQKDGTLSKRPDIVLLDKREYSASPSGELHQRKGFTLWGSAIMIEIKLLRTNQLERSELDSWMKDIDKLRDLYESHYSNGHARFFPLFVLYCKKQMPRSCSDSLRRHASHRGVSIMLACTGSEPEVHWHHMPEQGMA